MGLVSGKCIGMFVLCTQVEHIRKITVTFTSRLYRLIFFNLCAYINESEFILNDSVCTWHTNLHEPSPDFLPKGCRFETSQPNAWRFKVARD